MSIRDEFLDNGQVTDLSKATYKAEKKEDFFSEQDFIIKPRISPHPLTATRHQTVSQTAFVDAERIPKANVTVKKENAVKPTPTTSAVARPVSAPTHSLDSQKDADDTSEAEDTSATELAEKPLFPRKKHRWQSWAPPVTSDEDTEEDTEEDTTDISEDETETENETEVEPKNEIPEKNPTDAEGVLDHSKTASADAIAENVATKVVKSSDDDADNDIAKDKGADSTEDEEDEEGTENAKTEKTPPAKHRKLSEGGRNLIFLGAGATSIALITTTISLIWYHNSGDIYLDRSRPGFLPEQAETILEEQYVFPDNGTISDEVLDVYLKNLRKERKTIEVLENPYGETPLSDKSLGIPSAPLPAETNPTPTENN